MGIRGISRNRREKLKQKQENKKGNAQGITKMQRDARKKKDEGGWNEEEEKERRKEKRKEKKGKGKK